VVEHWVGFEHCSTWDTEESRLGSNLDRHDISKYDELTWDWDLDLVVPKFVHFQKNIQVVVEMELEQIYEWSWAEFGQSSFDDYGRN
jgi:hypothetical protein